MTSKILFIGQKLDPQVKDYLESGTTIERHGFGSQLPHLEYAVYAHIAIDKIIDLAVQAEKNGFDAVVIGCFYDPGLTEARELLTIPVIGVCEATLHVASTLCAGRFSILVGRSNWIPRMANNVSNYGFESKIASWRVMDLSVSDMENYEQTQKAILREGRIAVEQDFAEAICLGCTGMSGQAKYASGKIGVPVLDPLIIGLKTAEFRINLQKRLGISHGKKGGYESPPPKELQQILKKANAPAKVAEKITHFIRKIK